MPGFASSNTEATLCQASEKVAFSCSVGKKIVSVCSSDFHQKSKQTIRYLFGVPKKIELTLPENQNDRVSFGSLSYSGGGGAYIIFETNDFSYAVYSRILRQGQDAGVAIRKKGKIIKTLQCKLGPHSDMDLPMLEKLGLIKAPETFDPTM